MIKRGRHLSACFFVLDKVEQFFSLLIKANTSSSWELLIAYHFINVFLLCRFDLIFFSIPSYFCLLCDVTSVDSDLKGVCVDYLGYFFLALKSLFKQHNAFFVQSQICFFMCWRKRFSIIYVLTSLHLTYRSQHRCEKKKTFLQMKMKTAAMEKKFIGGFCAPRSTKTSLMRRHGRLKMFSSHAQKLSSPFSSTIAPHSSRKLCFCFAFRYCAFSRTFLLLLALKTETHPFSSWILLVIK